MDFLKMEIVTIPDPDWDNTQHVDDAVTYYENQGMVYMGEYVDGSLMEAIQERLAQIWK